MNYKKKQGHRKFQELAAQVNQAIIENDGLIGDQKAQVELLLQLEKKFQFYITRFKQSEKIYHDFVRFIVKENGNILSARPYFREKSTVFSKKITKAIRNDDVQALMKFSINFQLIDFIIGRWQGKIPERAELYYKDFLEARRILLENNLPLAINRAKLFYRKTPRSHLTLLDLIDICTYGLVSGIDKYCGDYNRARWANVCIGRMVGYMIEEYSKTFLRMYPSDKKILYRANSLRYRLKIESTVELTKAINDSFKQDKAEGKSVPKLPIREVHVRTLLNGSSYTSAYIKQNDTEDGGGYSIYDIAQDETRHNVYDATPEEKDSVESALIKKDIFAKIIAASEELTLIEKKIIRLKGVDL